MDRISSERRSWNMSRIHGKDTKPELLVRKYLYSNGIRYRLHSNLPGKPDIVIAKKKIAIFVNGCFWHAHKNCPDFRWPKTRSDFWKAKIESNVIRDRKNSLKLKGEGWKVVIIWECDIKKGFDKTITTLMRDLLSDH